MKGIIFTLLLTISVAGGCTVREQLELSQQKPTMSIEEQLQVGGLYSTESGEGDFRVAKVLALDDKGLHVRIYKNRFANRPTTIDVNSLSLGSINDPDGFGMGHLPLSREGFNGWRPVFITKANVTAEELEGYEMWKEAGGGVWP